jgi:hypothetical protein
MWAESMPQSPHIGGFLGRPPARGMSCGVGSFEGIGTRIPHQEPGTGWVRFLPLVSGNGCGLGPLQSPHYRGGFGWVDHDWHEL